MIHIMADYDEDIKRKSYKKFLMKNLIPYLVSRNFSIEKSSAQLPCLYVSRKDFKKENRK